MPPRISLQKCDGCKGEKEALCVAICPGDLMVLNEDTGKAYCRSTRDCWDCMSCVKACPQSAIETRLPYQLGYYPAKLIPLMGSKRVTWTCIDINNKIERFTYQNRND
ncbi:MAG: 4Fe-4S dicluster domain-containing protein [Bacillota bacterium]